MLLGGRLFSTDLCWHFNKCKSVYKKPMQDSATVWPPFIHHEIANVLMSYLEFIEFLDTDIAIASENFSPMKIKFILVESYIAI